MTDTRPSSMWSKIPGLVADLAQYIQDKLSASVAAEKISAKVGYPVTRNSMISKAHRMGLKFQSVDVGKYPRNPKIYRQVPVNILRVKLPSIPLPAEPLNEPGFLGLSLMELDRNQCKFAHGDGPFLFCGQPVWNETSYCALHHTITHQGYSKGY